MFLRIPYVTLVNFILFLGSLAINVVCIIKTTNIYQLFSYDMLKHNYLW